MYTPNLFWAKIESYPPEHSSQLSLQPRGLRVTGGRGFSGEGGERERAGERERERERLTTGYEPLRAIISAGAWLHAHSTAEETEGTLGAQGAMMNRKRGQRNSMVDFK